MTLTMVVPTIGRPTLVQTVLSLINQTVPLPFIVVPDVERLGCGPTMNRGVAMATTEFVGWLADDDEVDLRFHEWFIEEVGHGEVDMLIFKMQSAYGDPAPCYTDPELLRHGTVGGSFVMRTEVARRFPYITEQVDKGINEDWEMIRRARESGCAIRISERVAFRIRPWDKPVPQSNSDSRES